MPNALFLNFQNKSIYALILQTVKKEQKIMRITQIMKQFPTFPVYHNKTS